MNGLLTMILNAVPQSNMEWKPKSSQKSSLICPSIIGTATTPISPLASNSTISTEEVAHLPEKLSQVDISKDQHVIIPQHIRVPEADRSQLIFGSFKPGFESTKGFMSGLQAVDSAEEPKDEPAVRFVPFLCNTFIVFLPFSVLMSALYAMHRISKVWRIGNLAMTNHWRRRLGSWEFRTTPLDQWSGSEELAMFGEWGT